MRTAVVAGVTMVLSAASIAAPPAPPTMPNTFNDRLTALSPADRAGALRRAVTDADQRCGRLASNAYIGPWGNLRVWQVRCVPGGDYGVFVGPDGSIQARRCAELVGLAVRQCRMSPSG